MEKQQKRWRAISLFAGAGGCSLGFKNAGVDIIAAFENAEPAINTYNMNFGPGQCRQGRRRDADSMRFWRITERTGII